MEDDPLKVVKGPAVSLEGRFSLVTIPSIASGVHEEGSGLAVLDEGGRRTCNICFGLQHGMMQHSAAQSIDSNWNGSR